MKILVAIKRVIDYSVKVRVKADQTGVETASVKMSINPFDEIAIEEAIRLKEAGLAKEVMLATIAGPEAQESLRAGMALGADRGILVETDQSLLPIDIAKCLEKLVAEEQPQLVILGKQSIDGDNNQTGQMLATLLDWPLATFASELKLDANSCQVIREIDGGLETLALELPAVITTDLRLNEPRYAALPMIMKAKQKPLAVKTLVELGIEPKKRQTIVKVTEPAKREAGSIVADIDELVAKLKQEGVV